MTDDLLSLFDLLHDAFPTFDLAHLPPLIPFHSCDNKKSRSASGCQEHCGTLTRGGNDNQTLIFTFYCKFHSQIRIQNEATTQKAVAQ